jgi:hypothetical protein
MVSTKVYGLIAVLALTTAGCTTNRAPPVDVRLVPNDCVNRQLIINYLSEQAALPRGTLESQQDYERTRAEIRQRIWTMRYYCQPV